MQSRLQKTDKTVAVNIRRLREQRGLTQKQLADKLFVSDNVVSKWERGLSEPDIDTLKLISENFRVGIEELIGIPRLEKVAFPARKVEKGILYYVAFVAATLCFISATTAFCVLYVLALQGKDVLARPVGKSTFVFVPVAFGVVLISIFTVCSQMKFKAFSVFGNRYSGGKTLNEVLLLPCSIRDVYAVFGKWLAMYYFVFQMWNLFNIAAYILGADSVFRYVSHGFCVLALAIVTIFAGYAIKRTEEKDRAAAKMFEEKG